MLVHRKLLRPRYYTKDAKAPPQLRSAAATDHPSSTAATEEAQKKPPTSLPVYHTESFRNFLAARPEDADAAYAVFGITGDLVFLKECLAKWPDSTKLLSQMALREQDPGAKLKYAERLLVLTPGQSTGYYAKATALLKLGKISEAQSAFEEALTKSQPLTHDPRGAALLRQAIEATGKTADQARMSGVAYQGGLTLPLLLTLQNLAGDIYEDTAEGKAIGPERAAAMAEHLLQINHPLNSYRHAGLALQNGMLRRVDPELLFGDTGKTVGERLVEISSELQEVQQMGRESERLASSLSEQELGQYADDMATLGWRKALDILREKAKE